MAVVVDGILREEVPGARCGDGDGSGVSMLELEEGGLHLHSVR